MDTTQTIRIVVDARGAKSGSDEVRRGLKGVQDEASRAATAVERLESTLGVMVSRFKAFAVAAAIAWGTQLATGALAAASGLDELSEQLGVNTRYLQASQFAAVQAGLKIEQLETGFSKFSQKMGEASEGSKEMIESLDRIGVKILDTAGKLRPTEDLMVDVAAAIMKIEDPAKRSAAAVDFFSKSGTRMLPVLSDIAKGQDSMTAAARRNNAMISDETIKTLDRWADAAERNKRKMQASFAEGAAAVLDYAEKQAKAINDLKEARDKARASNSSDRGYEWEKKFRAESDAAMVEVYAFASGVLGVFENLADEIPKHFVDAFNDIIIDFEKLLNTLASGANSWFSKKRPEISLGRIPGGGGSADLAAGAQAAGEKARDAARKDAEEYYRRQRGIVFGGASDGTLWSVFNDGLPARSGPPPGASNPPVRGGGGDNIAKRTEKALADARLATDYAEQMAAASARGAAAVEDLETRYKAAKAAQDAFGENAKKSGAAVNALTEELYKLDKAAKAAAGLKDFNLATEQLEKANELLAAENGLINASAEARARELSLIRLKQEAEAKGLDVSNELHREAIDRRGVAIEQNERLKVQAEDLRRSNELWTEPLKAALQTIQSTAADAFEGMLESGRFSFQALGDVVKKTVIRMIAEFAALAIIRPMMGSMIGGLQGIGLVSGSTASSLGYGGSGTGGFSMPSFGGAGGGMFDFLGSQITPMSYGGAGSYDSIGQLIAQGTPGALGGLTWGGALAGASSIGMGAYSMATSKNTAGMIGGGLSILGGGIGMASMAGLLPMLGAAGGPIGMGLGLAGMLIPMLFGGGEEYKWDPLAGGNVQFNPGAGGYTSVGTTQQGGRDIAGQFSGVGTTLDSFFKQAGGITDASKAFGAAIWQNQREGTTSGYLLSPTQGSNQQIRDLSGDPTAAVDRLIAKAFYNSIQNNAAMNASPTLRTAFTNREPTSTAQISGLLDLIEVYDEFGKTTSQVETALKALDDRFKSLTDGANEWGLALAPIQEEQKKQIERTARDFVDGLIDPIAVQLRAFADEKRDILAGLEYIEANTDVHVDMARANEALLRKEAALKDQLYGGAVTQFEEAIKRLSPGGALSNLDPRGTMAGLEATYRATYGQAAAGDASAISRLAGEASALADYGKSYFAGSPEYSALRDEILANLRDIQTAVQGPQTTGGGTPLDVNGASSNNAQLQQLMATVEILLKENAKLQNLLSRYLTNGQRAA
ncbi:hypothetical protein [Reyranella sp.]|uniref:hypothetical protein n=1 Tax=Reyranella sp. TaxID=1929291 RepID=UPI0027300CE8|nr:hypothetical protein [Reyranella sp.]MDP2377789.1 hypothetical protein [Reyranella sp.]